jgi:septum formation inhibitor-activating ATPase MinD
VTPAIELEQLSFHKTSSCLLKTRFQLQTINSQQKLAVSCVCQRLKLRAICVLPEGKSFDLQL